MYAWHEPRRRQNICTCDGAPLCDTWRSSLVTFSTTDMQAIEVGEKKFFLDCREVKTGATICEANKNWALGRMTEVGVAKLRGDVQVLSGLRI
jgi:hypothetical protein